MCWGRWRALVALVLGRDRLWLLREVGLSLKPRHGCEMLKMMRPWCLSLSWWKRRSLGLELGSGVWQWMRT